MNLTSWKRRNWPDKSKPLLEVLFADGDTCLSQLFPPSITKASETARRTSVERGEEEVQEGSTSAQASKNFCMRLSYHRTLHVTSVIDRGFKPRRTLSFCVRYAGVDGKSMDVFDPPPIRRYRPLWFWNFSWISSNRCQFLSAFRTIISSLSSKLINFFEKYIVRNTISTLAGGRRNSGERARCHWARWKYTRSKNILPRPEWLNFRDSGLRYSTPSSTRSYRRGRFWLNFLWLMKAPVRVSPGPKTHLHPRCQPFFQRRAE